MMPRVRFATTPRPASEAAQVLAELADDCPLCRELLHSDDISPVWVGGPIAAVPGESAPRARRGRR